MYICCLYENYLILLTFLCVYQPRVSCWFETIWLCWIIAVYISSVSAVCIKLLDFTSVLSVYISPMSAVGLKLFDCVDFSLCISAPCQLLVWNFLTLLSFLSIYQPRVSCWFKTIWLCWASFLFVDQPRVSCWYETIWLCWVRLLCVY